MARKYLITSLKKQTEEFNKKIFLEKECSRIARDMNDSLDSELFGLKLLGQAALLKYGQEDTNSYIQKIVDASKGISEKISEVNWLTDSEQDNVESLWNYMSQIQKNALLCLKPSGIEYWFCDLPEGIFLFKGKEDTKCLISTACSFWNIQSLVICHNAKSDLKYRKFQF